MPLMVERHSRPVTLRRFLPHYAGSGRRAVVKTVAESPPARGRRENLTAPGLIVEAFSISQRWAFFAADSAGASTESSAESVTGA
jgi:hypothetical protein